MQDLAWGTGYGAGERIRGLYRDGVFLGQLRLCWREPLKGTPGWSLRWERPVPRAEAYFPGFGQSRTLIEADLATLLELYDDYLKDPSLFLMEQAL